jgi:PPK2 family polyphosphate:nucleotide phosphotransferase
MKIRTQQFRVSAGSRVRLRKWATAGALLYDSKNDYQKLLEKHVAQLDALQQLHYAANKYALLVILQGMDASGKDGVIRHVMSGVNPQGCQVHGFKTPTSAELEHDFLWRSTRVLPERGNIALFNRSYYEEVLIVRVHPELLRAEGSDAHAKIWRERYRSIVDFERHMHRNGTRIVKFFLHISREEQRRRFLARIDEPEKNWKLTLDDLSERNYWKQYMRAYEECLEATSTDFAPWFIVPADDKLSARLIVSQILLQTLGSLGLAYPTLTAKRRRELKAARKTLQQERP